MAPTPRARALAKAAELAAETYSRSRDVRDFFEEAAIRHQLAEELARVRGAVPSRAPMRGAYRSWSRDR